MEWRTRDAIKSAFPIQAPRFCLRQKTRGRGNMLNIVRIKVKLGFSILDEYRVSSIQYRVLRNECSLRYFAAFIASERLSVPS
jgi:hypothetical protein